MKKNKLALAMAAALMSTSVAADDSAMKAKLMELQE